MPGATRLSLVSGAARITVRGSADQQAISLDGRICAATAEQLEAAALSLRRAADQSVEIGTVASPIEQADAEEAPVLFILRVQVPADTALSITNGWGRTTVSGVDSVEMRMDHGDIAVGDIASDAFVRVGRGDIEATRIGNDLDVSRESGDLRIQMVGGAVTMACTGLGESVLKEVAGSVRVTRDGPGDMSFEEIGGDLTVEQDPSGDVHHKRVHGTISVDEERGPPSGRGHARRGGKEESES